MMWVFLSVLAICLTFIAWKFIDEGCDIDILNLCKRYDEINRRLIEIYKLLKVGGKDD